jgi:hypothetical protein
MISFNLAFAPFENLHRQPIAFFFKRDRLLKQPTEFIFFAQLRRKEARVNFVREYLPSLDLVWAVGDFDLNVILIEIKDLCDLRTGFDHRL